MSRSIEAIYADGVLKPLVALPFHDQQRLRLTIEAIDEQPAEGRDVRMQDLIECLQEGGFSYGGPLPTREELHQRDRDV
jgi:predicted DNA-binding antitoxin AbrB/MazE fold protein